MSTPRERSLRWHLATLSVGLLVPTLVFIGVLLWRLSLSERKGVEAQARDLSRTIAVALDREINGVLTTLQALSTSPSLQSGDLAGFYRQAREVSRLQGINISLRDLTGRTRITTRAAFGTEVSIPAVLAQADQEVLRSGKAMVTNIFASTITGMPVFQLVSAPVTVAGTPTYFLSASIDPGYLADVVRRENLPPGWIGTIVDSNGTIVARSERHAELVGKSVAPDFKLHATGTGGNYYGTNAEGTKVLVGHARSILTGWTTGANIAVDIVNAPLRRSLAALAGLGVVLGVVVSAVGWYARRLLTGAFDSLIGVAAAVGQGSPVDGIATPVAELNRVGSALRDAADQRRRAEEALRQLTGTLEAKVVERPATRSRAPRNDSSR